MWLHLYLPLTGISCARFLLDTTQLYLPNFRKNGLVLITFPRHVTIPQQNQENITLSFTTTLTGGLCVGDVMIRSSCLITTQQRNNEETITP